MKNRSDLIFSLVILTGGLIVLLKARAFPDLPEGHPGPGLFRTYIGSGFLLCGIFLLINALRSQVTINGDFSGTWISVLLILLLIGLFPLGYNFLGFFLTIAISIFLTGLLMRLKILSAVITSAITTGFIYLIFNQILHVPL